MCYNNKGGAVMKIVISDLSIVGARWVFLGNVAIVDPNYIDDFDEENPKVSVAPPGPGLMGIRSIRKYFNVSSIFYAACCPLLILGIFS